MDSRTRTFVKAITWQLLGLMMMTLLGFLVTGSLTAAGGLALSASAIGVFTYILHERLWARVGWGRVAPRDAQPVSQRSSV